MAKWKRERRENAVAREHDKSTNQRLGDQLSGLKSAY